MRRAATVSTLALLVTTAAFGHGASKGLHLHVTPEPATRGATVTVDVDAAEAMQRLRLGFVGSEPLTVTLDPPRSDATVKIEVPLTAEDETVNLHAEAVTVSGRVLRAAAVVRLVTE